MNSDQCYSLLGLNQGASMHEIRSAYRRLVLEYHPDKNIASKDDMKFKLITEAYQTLRINNKSVVGQNSNSVYQDRTNIDHNRKKIKPWYYLNAFYVLDYVQKIIYVKTVYRYLLKYKPLLVWCYGVIQKYTSTHVGRLIIPSYAGVKSFISYIQHRNLTQSLLKYLGIHT